MADDKVFHVDILNDKNWPVWSEKMKAVFIIKDCSVAIEPRVEGSPAVNEKKDKLAMSLIKLNINEDSLRSILDCASAREAWLLLENSYVQVQVACKQILVNQLCDIKKNGNEDMNMYVNRAAKIKQQLGSAGVELDISLFAGMVMKGLPEDYEAFRLDMIGAAAPRNVEEFRAKLIAAESTKVGHAVESENEVASKAFLAARRKCHYCGSYGHFKRDCQKRMSDMKVKEKVTYIAL